MGILKGRVDLAYRASSDPLKMHRALRIVKPDTDISGDYTCVVSTFMEEDSRTKQMICFWKTYVFITPKIAKTSANTTNYPKRNIREVSDVNGSGCPCGCQLACLYQDCPVQNH
ncbi:unnamed protein product [Parnassius apollo]|uniref:(apollo) hypothetical protein n=1 Tax=Parnassius apollo TaxID=110799 RepID=A0A8S3X8U9_PARAO|nr:unnamed protein product [Parnassius apollo]